MLWPCLAGAMPMTGWLTMRGVVCCSAAEKLKAQLQGGGSAENLGHLSKKARTASGSGSGSSLTDDNDDVAGSSERPAGFGVLARDGEGGGKDNATMDGELVDAVGAAASAAAHSAAQEAAAAAEFKTRLERSIKQKSDLSDKLDDDKVRLGEAGWKPRYYLQKFGVDIRTEEGRQLQRAVATSFVQGLVWTLRYYYQGVASWTWYFPYHYAPFASDLVDLQAMDISFEIGAPFKPFNQLMGVLPAASAHCLPKAYRPLMSEPSSPIVDFYPVQFEVDMNGKRWAWQGVALLPFIDEARLLTETARVEDTLTPDEARRNSQLSETIFCSAAHALAPTIYALYDKYSGASDPAARRAASATINPAASEHLNGTLRLCDGGGEACPPRFTSPVPGLPDVVPNSVVSAAFDNPTPRKHECRLPPGSVPDAPIVTAQDLKATVLWHEQVRDRMTLLSVAAAAGVSGAHWRMLLLARCSATCPVGRQRAWTWAWRPGRGAAGTGSASHAAAQPSQPAARRRSSVHGRVQHGPRPWPRRQHQQRQWQLPQARRRRCRRRRLDVQAALAPTAAADRRGGEPAAAAAAVLAADDPGRATATAALPAPAAADDVRSGAAAAAEHRGSAAAALHGSGARAAGGARPAGPAAASPGSQPTHLAS
eukprot:scaffold4085_cov264-Prasinococcus_capsulatus_cf.AAC.2